MSNNNLEKFAFVGVLMAATLFSGTYSRGGLEEKNPQASSPLQSALVASLTAPAPVLRDGDGETESRVSPKTPPLPEQPITQLGRDVGPQSPVFYRVLSGNPEFSQAAAALVARADGKEDYYLMRAERRWPIASITKLMTAVVAFKLFDLDEVIAFREGDIRTARSQNSFIEAGDLYKVRDILRMMLLKSWNEAAEALAGRFGRVQFIAAMNEQARQWELGDTYFSDPTGLGVSNQSTARDLKKFAAHLYAEYPEIFLIGRQRSAVVTEQISGRRSAISNINAFSGHPAFLGGKTGFTEESNGNLLSLFGYGGHPIVVVVLGSDDRFAETEALMAWFRSAYKPSL